MRAETISKILYGIFFCVVVPVILYRWSQRVVVNLPLGEWTAGGWILTLSGLAFVFKGMADLRRYGKGLPMNAFPPPEFVSQGSYEIFRHPIYTGFCIFCAGAACLLRSPSLLYFITPVVMICCWALAKGHEEPDLERRFGKREHRSVFSPPEDSTEPVTFHEKVLRAIPVFTVWAIGYELMIYFGIGKNFIDTTLPFERGWPVIPVAEIPYFFIYPFVALPPLLTRTRSDLRFFATTGLAAVSAGIFFLILFPFYTPFRPITTVGWLSDLMQWERKMDGSSAAFPSFHVIWALISAATLTKIYPRMKWLWVTIAASIAWSCSAAGVHSIADIFSALMLFTGVWYRKSLWTAIQNASQRLANSWRAWQIGNFRIINHSIYAGLAGFTGVAIASQFIGNTSVLIIITLATLLGGALWGQWIEGSSILLRPFGYYGAILGGAIGTIVCSIAFTISWQLILTAFAMAAPWTQAIGRLRCLVQGCCHGRIAENGAGIIYWNEHSRVCKISGLRGKILHNTQLYSIGANFIIGAVLWRLWYSEAGAGMIAGVYFILNGAARFVEERYRGEVQTKILRGLSLYQWTAVGSFVAGAMLTTLPSKSTADYTPHWSLPYLITMIASGLVSAFALGMDFPKSRIPFSRLTG